MRFLFAILFIISFSAHSAVSDLNFINQKGKFSSRTALESTSSELDGTYQTVGTTFCTGSTGPFVIVLSRILLPSICEMMPLFAKFK